MKLLRGTLQLSGHRVRRLANPEDLDLLHFEDIGEMPEGLDFAILWKCVWREGRYVDAQRLLPRAGMQTPGPDYALEPKRLLELAITYARELGYTSTEPGEIVDLNTIIEARESMEVAIPTEKKATASGDHHHSLQQRGYPPPHLKQIVPQDALQRLLTSARLKGVISWE